MEKKITKEQQLAADMTLVGALLKTYREAKLNGANEQEAIAVTTAYMAALLISARQTRPDEAEGGTK